MAKQTRLTPELRAAVDAQKSMGRRALEETTTGAATAYARLASEKADADAVRMGPSAPAPEEAAPAPASPADVLARRVASNLLARKARDARRGSAPPSEAPEAATEAAPATPAAPAARQSY